MEAHRLAAIVAARDEAARIRGTLEALDRELAPFAGCRRMVVDAASRDHTAALALGAGWPVLALDPEGAVTASAAREAGRRATWGGSGRPARERPRYLLYVDGDVEIDPGFVVAALGLLEGDGRLAGVGGELRFDEGRGAPPPGAAGVVRPVGLLAALALYRAQALEQVGGFVPWLESEEDADLGLRLRHAGFQLARIRPGGVHRSGPRGGLRETFRRYHAGLYFGQGRTLKLRWGGPLFAETLRRQRLYLGVIAAWVAAGLGSAYTPLAGPALAAGLVVAWVDVARRKRSAWAGAVSVVTWHVMAFGLLAGVVRPPRATEARVAADPEGGA
jgi:hypothetical protein